MRALLKETQWPNLNTHGNTLRSGSLSLPPPPYQTLGSRDDAVCALSRLPGQGPPDGPNSVIKTQTMQSRHDAVRAPSLSDRCNLRAPHPLWAPPPPSQTLGSRDDAVRALSRLPGLGPPDLVWARKVSRGPLGSETMVRGDGRDDVMT